ncbi:hypothetical protein [uncultured Winogradskyella sp.]|uniref:hypothetical protein n=1 Tax=uncultured Winogradskyella sp. TaxID=395353 RepID=UPI0026177E4C|nr:hypothetical protein [uncultured Winogradskyella sp.]
MAPIKFEENIKDKLEKRILSPSQGGWSKLSDRLNEDQKKSKKPLYWWLSIAAGLLLMMAIAVQFFNTVDSDKNLPQFVNEDNNEVEINKSEIQPNKNAIELVEHEKVVEVKLEKSEILPELNNSNHNDFKKVIKGQATIDSKLASHDNSEETESVTVKNKVIKKEEQNIIDNAMLKEALAVAMQELKSEQPEVSDREIDSLLKVASKELFKENIKSESIKVTDVEALLISVEDEMGQSFRTKVFEALKDSYNTVKTAVADRNN